MRDRTADLLDANQTLSQLSYGPRTSIYSLNQAIEVSTYRRLFINGKPFPNGVSL